jgi:hypothetical protein
LFGGISVQSSAVPFLAVVLPLDCREAFFDEVGDGFVGIQEPVTVQGLPEFGGNDKTGIESQSLDF